MKTRLDRGGLFVVSAPSGAGKTSLCRELCSSLPGIMHSVSYTTRGPRPGEVDGKDYYFVDEERFASMERAGEFAEWARVHGNLYGTSRRKVEEMLSRGTDLILDIDTEGAKRIKETVPGAVFVFVLPPSMRILTDRLAGRMSDSAEEVRRRLQRARAEIGEYKMYDYVIINDNFEEALGQLRAIVLSGRLRTGTINHEWVDKSFLNQEEV